MNHQKIYDNIISKAKFENRIKYKGIYYEEHHIIPKCLGGNNKKENKVLLTAKEHFIEHKLLTYIYKGNRKIAYAFHRMTYSKNGNYIKSARDYAYAIELIKSTPISKETKEKLSKALLGNKRLLGHKHSDETRRKIGEKSKLRIYKHSEETKQKIGNGNLGKKRSDEVKKGISERAKLIKHSRESIEITRKKNIGRKYSIESRKKISASLKQFHLNIKEKE